MYKTKPIQIYRTKIIPEIKDYYDILSASLGRVNDKLIFSMDLAGDPIKNEKSEIPLFGCYIMIHLDERYGQDYLHSKALTLNFLWIG
jgi:hypothetical protein